MSSDKIYISALAREIADTLSDYSEDITEKVNSAADEVAKAGVKNLKRLSPRLTGKYAKGWAVKTVQGKYASNIKIIHNRSHYQLTHLLEHGHAKENGGRVEGKPHIAPTENMIVKEFTKKTEEAIRNG